MPFAESPDANDRQSRRGRPRTGERQQRRLDVLEAAAHELVDRGYENVTMLGIARRAGASKETLYSWFGNKGGLLKALIEQEATSAATTISAALGRPGPPTTILVEGAYALLTRATSDTSVALRRAAVTSPELGQHALRLEQERVDPIIDSYMAQLTRQGPYLVPDIGSAHRMFRSLVTSDLELRILLGQESPTDNELQARASTGVARFLSLVEPA